MMLQYCVSPLLDVGFAALCPTQFLSVSDTNKYLMVEQNEWNFTLVIFLTKQPRKP